MAENTFTFTVTVNLAEREPSADISEKEALARLQHACRYMHGYSRMYTPATFTATAIEPVPKAPSFADVDEDPEWLARAEKKLGLASKDRWFAVDGETRQRWVGDILDENDENLAVALSGLLRSWGDSTPEVAEVYKAFWAKSGSFDFDEWLEKRV